MAAPKINSSELKKLFTEEKDQNLQNKKIIEALQKRLNEILQNTHQAKKAAMIIESWMKKKL
jgi:biotin-(acetyl-CoA carboxylase) ligase